MQHEKLTQFIEFCESLHPDTMYNWDDAGQCALGQFNGYNSAGWEDEFHTINSVARFEPQTFGDLAERVKLEFGIN
jgi:hypothetical protein